MDKKTKVCFFSVHGYALFFPSQSTKFGGAEIQMYQLSKEMAKDGQYEVSFITYHTEKVKTTKIDGVKIFVVYPLFSKSRILRALSRKMMLLKHLLAVGADVYIQRAAGIETGITAFFCKLFKKKFIYMTAHEFDCSGEYERKSGYCGKVYAAGIRNASLVITQNIGHQEILKKNYGLDSVVLKNSFTLPVRTDTGRSGLLWVARLEKWKQPEMLIDLARKFPKEQFTMVAPVSNDQEYAIKIKAQADSVGNIMYIPQVPFEEIGNYFKKARIFVNTSQYEGFPNTFVQAAMYGTPIVSLNVNPDNFLNEYQCGCCAEGSEENMFGQVKKLLENDADWQESSKHAYAYVKANHDIEMNIKKLKEIILSL